jgi:hypothetical protein
VGIFGNKEETTEEKKVDTAEQDALKELENLEAEKIELSDEDRTFEVTIEDPEGKKTKVKAMIPVDKIYIDGKKFTAEEFLADKEAQVTAVAAGHILIKKLK